ncbi:chaplin [Actinacidiphila sp. bgisy167]|uniref:chaplin n=1 Tax=Actinacidiphila sp. bgisy167 TaxID=3413797 RepID=UPI003D749024
MSVWGMSLGVVVVAGVLVVSGAGVASADNDAKGLLAAAPGLLSGNNLQQPILLPFNACGNPSPGLLSLLSPSFGDCVNVTKDNGNAIVGKS